MEGQGWGELHHTSFWYLGAILPSLGRVAMVEKAKARGENPYPHKFDVSIQLPAYVEKYGGLE